MRSISRRIGQAEADAVSAGFSEYDGMSEERLASEMQHLLRITYYGETGPEAGRIIELLGACTVDEFQRAWAAKLARDARENAAEVVGAGSVEGRIPVEIALRLEDFIAAGVIVPSAKDLVDLAQPQGFSVNLKRGSLGRD